MTENTSLAPTLGVFAGCYVLVTALVVVAVFLIDFQPNSGVNIGMLIGSALVATYWFSRRHARRFSKAEAWRMTIYSLILCWLLSTAMFALYMAINPSFAYVLRALFQDAEPLALSVIFLVVSGVYLLILFIIYRWLARFVVMAVRG